MVPAPLETAAHQNASYGYLSSRTLLAGGSDLVLGEDEVVDKVVIFKLIAITSEFVYETPR
jgi:hypothetical protein